MVITILTSLTYILREAFTFHVFKGSMQAHVAICTITNARLLLSLEKEEHQHFISDICIHGPALSYLVSCSGKLQTVRGE